MKKIRVITIDGPSASGKTTIARLLSERLGVHYVDTGAMYRAFALFALRNGVSPDDESSLKPLLDRFDLEIRYDERGMRVLINGEDVTEDVRKKEMGDSASRVSLHPSVRMKMVELQRKIGYTTGGIFDGRDMGTFVFPDAELKIFLTASIEERAKRKLKEWREKGIPGTLEEAMRDICDRDWRDTTRALAPLKEPDDAVKIDTTHLSPQEVLERILHEISKR